MRWTDSNSHGAQVVLDMLFGCAAVLPVKFLVASRPGPGVHAKMAAGDDRSRAILHLRDIERSLVREDIETYLKEELQSVALSTHQLHQLTEQAGNLFIYAATAV
jgi:hypothetical protein